MRATFWACWFWREVAGCIVAMCGGVAVVENTRAGQLLTQPPSFMVTNIFQARGLASQNPDVSYFIRLEGNVWWANPAQGRLVLKDESGAEELEMDLRGQRVLPGRGCVWKAMER
jgi:hypothetical protein